MLLWLPQDASIKLQNIHHMSRRKAKLEAKESRGRETSSHPDGMEKSHLAIKESYNPHMTRLGHKDQDSNSFSNSHHLHMLVVGFEKHLSYVTQMHILTCKGP